MTEDQWNRIPVAMLSNDQHHSMTFTDNISTMMTKLPTFNECGFTVQKKELEKTFDPKSMNNIQASSTPNEIETIKGLIPPWIQEFIGVHFPKDSYTFVLFQCGSLALMLQKNVTEKSKLFSFLREYAAPAHRIPAEKDLHDNFISNERWWLDYQKTHNKQEVVMASIALRSLTKCYPTAGSNVSDADTFAMWKKKGKDYYIATCGLVCSGKVFSVVSTKKNSKWTENNKEYVCATIARDSFRLDYLEPRIVCMFGGKFE